MASLFLPVAMKQMDKAFGNVKKELLKDLKGRVLDVGCGSGDWLKYFGNAEEIVELEPNSHHNGNIKKNIDKFLMDHPKVKIEIKNCFVEELDITKPFDYIVFGNVMCEVPDQKSFLLAVNRVLKPGGKVVFMEHIRGKEGSLQGWLQDLINPIWCRASDGCNCNRNTVEMIKKTNNWETIWFDLTSQDTPYFLRRMAVGIAMKHQSKF